MNKDGKPRKKRTKVELINHYSPFGKFLINHRQLREKNNLLIKYKSKAPVPTLRGTLISDNFVSLISDILDTKRINIQTQKKLDKDEGDLFDHLIKTCKLVNDLNYHRVSMDMNDIMKLFEILRGGFMAGNHSIELKNELIDVITLLSSPIAKKITKDDANDFIDYINNI